MTLAQVEKQALRQFNECCSLGLNLSFLTVLETMYETASEKKQYVKCDHITTLIAEDINS